jgi:hypothetical protein
VLEYWQTTQNWENLRRMLSPLAVAIGQSFPSRGALNHADSALRIRPVPIPQAPLTRKAVNSKGRCHPPPMGRPLSGNTTRRATMEGRIAPKKKATTQ